MAPPGWDYLPQAEEDALHNSARLLSIEWRPYQRVAARLGPGALNNTRPNQLPTPPPEGSISNEEYAALVAERERQIITLRNWRNVATDEIGLLGFSVQRMELITNQNRAERERYAEAKTAITAKQQVVKENIETLRDRLKVAKETMAIRKEYDQLTEKITNSKMLKPRDEQAAAHAKLDEEIAELQLEVENSKKTWAERRTQFGRIEEEAVEMLRMIKDEKEEAERKEGMMKDGDELEDGEASTTRGGLSQAGTPRPDTGSGTPMHITNGDEQTLSLRLPQDRLASFSRGTSVAASVVRSNIDDTDMAESGGGAKDDDSDGIEEGEEAEDSGAPEGMDES